MKLTLDPDMQRFIEEMVEAGQYERPEDVVRAALAGLMQRRENGFAPGELDALLGEGEADIRRGDVLDADDVFRELRGISDGHGRGDRPE